MLVSFNVGRNPHAHIIRNTLQFDDSRLTDTCACCVVASCAPLQSFAWHLSRPELELLHTGETTDRFSIIYLLKVLIGWVDKETRRRQSPHGDGVVTLGGLRGWNDRDLQRLKNEVDPEI